MCMSRFCGLFFIGLQVGKQVVGVEKAGGQISETLKGKERRK